MLDREPPKRRPAAAGRDRKAEFCDGMLDGVVYPSHGLSIGCAPPRHIDGLPSVSARRLRGWFQNVTLQPSRHAGRAGSADQVVERSDTFTTCCVRRSTGR